MIQRILRLYQNNINGCVVPTTNDIDNINATIIEKQKKYDAYLNVVNKARASLLNAPQCLLGKELSKLQSLYSFVNTVTIAYNSSKYCEDKFLHYVIQYSINNLGILKTELSNLATQLENAKQVYEDDKITYNQCLELLATQQQAQTNLTTAKTEATATDILLTQTQAETETKKISAFLPYIFGGVVLVGGGIYFLTKDKKRKK